MAEIRLVRSNEFGEAAKLADLVFREASQSSMADAFPAIFKNGLGQSWGAFENGEILSFMGAVPAWIRIGPARLRVYSIGAVCTRPDSRGRGFAGQLLERVLEQAGRAGASLLLVSGDRSLYRRAGCYPFGTVRRYLAEPVQKAASPVQGDGTSPLIRELREEDWFSLHQMAADKPVRYDTGLGEFIQAVRSEAIAGNGKRSQRVLVAERKGVPSAFAVFAIPAAGEDRHGLLVDWGGNAADAVELIGQAAADAAVPVRVHIPWQEEEISSELNASFAGFGPNQGTIKIIDAARLWEQLAPYLEERSREAASSIRMEPADEAGMLRLRAGDSERVVRAEELAAYLFDAEGKAELPEPFNTLLRPFVPLPFPHTEGLSYV